MIEFEYSETADAVYIRLSELPYAHGSDLDDDRRVDYAANGEIIGIELLGVSEGVHLDGLPRRDVIERVLAEHRIPVFA